MSKSLKIGNLIALNALNNPLASYSLKNFSLSRVSIRRLFLLFLYFLVYILLDFLENDSSALNEKLTNII